MGKKIIMVFSNWKDFVERFEGLGYYFNQGGYQNEKAIFRHKTESESCIMNMASSYIDGYMAIYPHNRNNLKQRTMNMLKMRMGRNKI